MTVPDSSDNISLASSSNTLASPPSQSPSNFFRALRRYPRLAIGLGVGILSGIGLMISNPSPDQYTTYAAEQADEWLLDKCSTAKGNLQVALFSVPLKDICQGAVQLGGKGVEFGIEQTTQRKNYGLFSVYVTDIPTQGTFKTVGIGGQLITFEKGE